MTLETIQVLGFGLPVVILALVQVAKLHPKVTGPVVPIIAVIVGVLLATGWQASQSYPIVETWLNTVLSGLLNGLAAVGLWSGVKNTIGK